jgi:hypothetical protein
MDVFVTDGRLVDHSLSAKPYTDSAFDMPAQYAAPRRPAPPPVRAIRRRHLGRRGEEDGESLDCP